MGLFQEPYHLSVFWPTQSGVSMPVCQEVAQSGGDLNSCKISQGYVNQEFVSGLEGELRVLCLFSLLYLGLQTPISFHF